MGKRKVMTKAKAKAMVRGEKGKRKVVAKAGAMVGKW